MLRLVTAGVWPTGIEQCGERTAVSGVRSAASGVRRAECGERSAACGVRHADYAFGCRKSLSLAACASSQNTP